MPAIDIDHLKRIYKTYIGVIRRTRKEVVAVEDISLQIEDGELFGLLGPNGAGKTTTVKVLATLLIPTAGRVTIRGLDVVKDANEIRKMIGFIFGGERGLYWRLSGIDNLRYFGALYHVDPDETRKRIPYLLELVGLKDRGKEKVEGYSRGMMQRLHVARTLLHNPPLLFLDEPTIGLDPLGAREFRQVILDLQSERKTILLTTHYMFEADQLCQRVAVINHGRIIAMDTPAALKTGVQDLSVIELEVFGSAAELLPRIRSEPYVDSVSVEDREHKQVILVQTRRGREAVPDLLPLLKDFNLGSVSVREPTLEDAYVRLVGESGGTG